MYCEMCGNKAEEFYEAEIEEAKLIVCPACANFGRVLRRVTTQKETMKAVAAIAKHGPAAPFTPAGELDVAEGYGRKIAQARDKAGIRRDELAYSLNEPESQLKRIEDEKSVPSAALLAKLEKALNIRLTEEVEAHRLAAPRPKKTGPLTLADIAEIK